MFAPPEFSTVAIESGPEVGRKSFRQEQFAFAEGTEGDGASGVRAFMEHLARSILLFGKISVREISRAMHAKGRSARRYVKSS
jgi:hypothetical protein